VGEILGNNMVYSLNYVWPRSGRYIDAGQAVYVLIGGPTFSIFQALCGLLLLEKYGSIYIYPFAFTPTFSRFFSLLFGGFGLQDEAKISVMLGVGTYTVAIIVLVILLLPAILCSARLKMGLKENGYAVVFSTVSQLLVIGTYKVFS
jgi:hypothetical protein